MATIKEIREARAYAWNVNTQEARSTVKAADMCIYYHGNKNRFEEYKKLFLMQEKIHNLQDKLLELDNDESTYQLQFTKDAHRREDNKLKEFKKLARHLGLRTVYYSWRVSLETKDGRQIR